MFGLCCLKLPCCYCSELFAVLRQTDCGMAKNVLVYQVLFVVSM